MAAVPLAVLLCCGCNLRAINLTEWLSRREGPVAEGLVTSEGKGLVNVRVSDGYRVVATDHHGKFQIPLEAESGPFIFVITPHGYWIDRFWVPIQEALRGPIHFLLSPRTQLEDFSFLFLTDLHLGEGNPPGKSFQRFASTLEEIKSLTPKPAFLWFGGDISLQLGWGPKFRRMVEELNLPVRTCIGGDDFFAHRPDPREEYHFFYGPSYYSFDWGRLHFVALDGCKAAAGSQGEKTVHAELSKRELFWLEEDLRSVPEGTLTIVAVHIPVLSTYPLRRGTIAESSPFWMFQNSGEILQILHRYNVPLVLQGHLHENERIVRDKIEFAETVSLCGRWWQSVGKELGASNEPRGYRRIDVSGLRIWNTYISAESAVSAIGEVVGRPEKLERAPKVSILLNLYDGNTESEVAARVDNSKWEALKPISPEGPSESGLMAHHWGWNVDTRFWPSGAHVLQFRIRETGKLDFFIEHRVDVD
ncbi:MAG: metallophosphoesterase [Planctomycetes bacterium]|nr:metallophosphoesterase [Planctomycetota bacterium]